MILESSIPSRSSIVVDDDSNGKHVSDFLLIINGNYISVSNHLPHVVT